MDVYPLDLILAVATASATIFLGFLPTKYVSSAFFARETLKASIAWIVVAIASPLQIFHYPLILAIICLAAWGKFRDDHAFSGKLWLNLASGLGISIGVIFILAVTPQAYPPGLSQLSATLLLASIYLGGAVIGLAYVSYVLTKSMSIYSSISSRLVEHYVGLMLSLILARAAVLLITFGVAAVFQVGEWVAIRNPTEMSEAVSLFGLAVLILPAMSFYAKRASSFSSRVQPTRALLAICLFGLLAEVLARLLVL